jgi:hypothetical protein
MSSPTLKPSPVKAPAEASQVASARNDLTCLAAISLFGHCRQVELAVAVWPKSPLASSIVSAGKAIRRLMDRGHIAERWNRLPGRSYVLQMGGVARLRRHGITAEVGTGLDLTGQHVWHRIFGMRYLLERRAASGQPAWGEYAIEKGLSPLKRGDMLDQFGKLPDGLAQASPGVLDWIEVENSVKGWNAVQRMLNMATHSGVELDGDGKWKLGRVVFVYNRKQGHEAMLLKGLAALLRKTAPQNRERVLAAVVLVPVEVELPLAWKSYEEHSGAAALALSGINDNYPPKKPRKISRKQQAKEEWEMQIEADRAQAVAEWEAQRDAALEAEEQRRAAEPEGARHPMTGERVWPEEDDPLDWNRGEDD